MFSHFPTVIWCFWGWAQEVIDVVEHADCERRWEGDSFIRNRHLLLGLLSSRIAESVQEFGRFRDDGNESSMRHVYETYMVTEDVARMFGTTSFASCRCLLHSPWSLFSCCVVWLCYWLCDDVFEIWSVCFNLFNCVLLMNVL